MKRTSEMNASLFRSSRVLVMLLALGLAGGAPGAEVDFQREVRPILAEHCLACHGVDAAARKGGLRLDQRATALKGGKSGAAAVVPGHPEQSELLRRVSSPDADTVMPPPKQKKPLSAKQLETLKKWVAEGASYETHWAFTPPVKAKLPPVGRANPVDAFVVARLKGLNLSLSPEAPSGTLYRRLYLDLIGLPPSPKELAACERDGYEATVDRLLRSERFGEKWARHWLDVARYSDTNGYEKDLRREQWAWRDWIVDALNRDMPYDRFLIEQVAGDLLPGAGQSQRVATGFLRNSMINEEGAIIPEEFRMVEMFDRMDCVGKAVLGLTTQCAQCHSHKFDPLSQDEYYGMFAFLNDSYEAQSWVYTPEQLRALAGLCARIAAVEHRVRAARPRWAQELAAWENERSRRRVAWEPLIAVELGSISGLNHPTQEADRSLLMIGHPSDDVFMIAEPDLTGVTGLQLEALTHRDLPNNGPGRSPAGTWAVRELEVFARKPGDKDWQKLKLVNATADFSQPERREGDKKKASGPVAFLIDGSDDTTWSSDRGPGRRNEPSVAVVQFEPPLTLPPKTQLKVALRMDGGVGMLGCCRLSITRQPAPAAPPADHAAMLALQTPAADRTTEQSAAVFAAWRSSVAELKALNEEIDALRKAVPQAATSVLHLREREPANRRSTYLLNRGIWDRAVRKVEPHVPTVLHPFPPDAPRNRLGFARWLADRSSPLTARVAVNRVWQAIFGAGLVETPEDFGTRAPSPQYRELLDWLAVDFMDHGWRQKQLIRTIVTSAVYRQSSGATPELRERDPHNALLARGPRFRADAEVVRDIALSASGLLVNKLGGPAVIPPVPQNVLDYNFTYPAYWKPAEGPERYRRTLYGFRKRSMPDPVMTSFDGPNGDFACARRARSNTPLAALTGLNEPVFVEASRALALRVLREGGADDAKRIDCALLLCVSRPARPAERETLLALLQSTRKRLADGWLNPREVTTGDPAKLPALPDGATPQDAAAWTIVARVLLNLDETVSKN
jgi:mono/diheme cytochrome c family protein